VLLLATVALLAGGTRHDQLTFRTLFALGLIGISLAMWLVERRPPVWFAHADLLAFNLALFLLLGEVSLRLVSAHSSIALLLPNTLDSFRLEPGRDYGAGLRGNRLGYPGPDHEVHKPAGAFRIAALGDSFAVGPAVAFEDNYLTRLEAALPRAQVLNFGVSGAGPREYLEILRTHALTFEPDLVLVSFFVGNDVTESLAVPRGLDPHQYSLFLAAQRGLRMLERAKSNHNLKDRLAGASFSEAQFLEIEARRLEVCRNPVPLAIEKKWERALQRLAEIAQLCAKAEVRCGVVLIPDEFQVNKEVCEAARIRAGIPRETLNMELPQQRLSEFLAKRKIACLDLLPAFREAHDAYAPRDTHWNASGNRLAAREIAGWLRQNGLLPSTQ
jgi:hypothetical protein